MRTIQIALIGTGGFGQNHLKRIRQFQNEGRVRLAACCDRSLERLEADLKDFDIENIALYTDYQELLEKEKQVELVVITTPIPLHCDMCCNALEAGKHVLLEKPPAVTIQDIEKMIEVQEKTQKICAVGFQMVSDKSFQYLLQMLKDGLIGKIQRVTAIGMWRRGFDYYARTPWAGKLKYDDKYVLDGTINNPLSHLLNNSLIAAAINTPGKKYPEYVKSELYRANDIEGDDTACVRIQLANETEILFYSTVCSHAENTPFIEISGSMGKVFWDYKGKVVLTQNNGKQTERLIDSKSDITLYEHVIDCVLGKQEKPDCTLQDAKAFVLASNLAFESSGAIHKIAGEFIEVCSKSMDVSKTESSHNGYLYLKDIEKIIHNAAEKNRLFSENQVPWAVETSRVKAEGYKKFGW